MHATAGCISNAFGKRRHTVCIGEIHTKPSGATTRGNERIRASTRIGLLAVHEKHTCAEFGKGRGNRLAHLPFATDSCKYHTTSGEIHAPPVSDRRLRRTKQ